MYFIVRELLLLFPYRNEKNIKEMENEYATFQKIVSTSNFALEIRNSSFYIKYGECSANHSRNQTFWGVGSNSFGPCVVLLYY